MPSNLDFWVGQKIKKFPKQRNSIVFVFLHPIICIWAPQAKFLCFWYSKYHFYNEISILFMKIFACGARDPQELYICSVIYMPSNPDFWAKKHNLYICPVIYMPSDLCIVFLCEMVNLTSRFPGNFQVKIWSISGNFRTKI